MPLSARAIQVLKPEVTSGIIPLSTNAVRLAWQRLKRRAGVQGLRMHDLRREAASRAFEKGLGIESVMVLTGHKTPSILLTHYTALKASEVASKLGGGAMPDGAPPFDGEARFMGLELSGALGVAKGESSWTP